MGDAVLLSAPNEEPVTALYAYISTDGLGNEGLCGGPGPMGGLIPYVFVYERVALKCEPMVEKLRQLDPTKKIRLVKFTTRETLRDYGGPNGH